MHNGDAKHNDQQFHAATIYLLAIIVFAGFSRTYYLHSLFHNPLPSSFLVFHGAIMTGWMVLISVQTLLVRTHHIGWHKRLGLGGIAYAALMIPIGCIATLNAARREVLGHTTYVLSQLNVLGLELTQLMMFGGFVVTAICFRMRGDVHKRLMLLATLCIVPNALVRLLVLTDLPFLSENLGILTVWAVLVAGIIAIDTLRNHRLHPAFAWGGVIAIGLLYLAWFISTTAAWDGYWIRTFV